MITRAEVLVGVIHEDSINVKRFLDFFEAVPITLEIADLAAELRNKYKWRLPDALQAAICTYYDLTLVTRNTKDFSSKKHHFVYIPYQTHYN